MLEPLLYLLSGFLMKIADDAADKGDRKFFGILTGSLCGISIGVLITISLDATYIFFGIFIGTLIAGKIDNINHFLAAGFFLIIVLIRGIPSLEPATLLICTLAAFLDEIGNENQWIYKRSDFLRVFFHYRFALKIAILILAIFPLISDLPIQSLRWYSFFFFLFFELAYEITGRVDDLIMKS